MPSALTARFRKPAFLGYGGIIAASLCLGGSATAQEDRMWRPAEATIYRDAGYNGPAVFVDEGKPDLDLPWTVNSIRIQSGRWQLCERTQYRGTCRIYDADTPVLNTVLRGRRVQSLRPVGGGSLPGPGTGIGGPSLRGMSSQYFAKPELYGQRVRACPTGSATAACGARSADNFCRSMGWNGAAWQTMETVSRVVYLSDVLCTRTGY